MQFSHKMPLYVSYTMVQKIKDDQKLISRGPALNISKGTGWGQNFTSLQGVECVSHRFQINIFP